MKKKPQVCVLDSELDILFGELVHMNNRLITVGHPVFFVSSKNHLRIFEILAPVIHSK
jgi:hypothetical protein